MLLPRLNSLPTWSHFFTYPRLLADAYSLSIASSRRTPALSPLSALWSPLSHIHPLVLTCLCLPGWMVSRDPVCFILSDFSSTPVLCLVQNRWTWINICGMNGWMSEWRKEQFCTACTHLCSLSTFLSHPPALLQHLGKEGKLLNLKNLQGSCFTPALLPGWEFLIYSISSIPDGEKLNDLTKTKWLHSGRGSSPSSWVQSLSARFKDIVRYSEYALS